MRRSATEIGRLVTAQITRDVGSRILGESFMNVSIRAGQASVELDEVFQVPGGDAFNMLLLNMP